MKRNIIIFASLIIILFIGLFIFISNQNDHNIIELTVTESKDKDYKWDYEIEDKKIVEYVKDYVVNEENNGKNINYVFKGIKEGYTKIRLKYININDGSIIKEQEHTLKVDKFHNISLVLFVK